jgi:hypothetical protein
MRPVFVVLGQIRIDQMPQMRLAEHDEVIEALAFHALHPAFGKGVQIRRTGRNQLKGDAVVLDDGTELLGELRVAIADEDRRLELVASLKQSAT